MKFAILASIALAQVVIEDPHYGFNTFTTVTGSSKANACLKIENMGDGDESLVGAMTKSVAQLTVGTKTFKGVVGTDAKAQTVGRTNKYKIRVKFDTRGADETTIIALRARALLSIVGTVNANDQHDGHYWSAHIDIDTGSQAGKARFPNTLYSRGAPALTDAANLVLSKTPSGELCGRHIPMWF
jgi:hypothetical protein